MHSFVGDPSRWRTDIPSYAAVVYKGVYPGIDLRFHGDQKTLEYDVVVQPGADPSVVRFALEGPGDARVSPEGDLVLAFGADELRQKAPDVYQEKDGRRTKVDGSFKLEASAGAGSTYSLRGRHLRPRPRARHRSRPQLFLLPGRHRQRQRPGRGGHRGRRRHRGGEHGVRQLRRHGGRVRHHVQHEHRRLRLPFRHHADRCGFARLLHVPGRHRRRRGQRREGRQRGRQRLPDRVHRERQLPDHGRGAGHDGERRARRLLHPAERRRQRPSVLDLPGHRGRGRGVRHRRRLRHRRGLDYRPDRQRRVPDDRGGL